MSYVIEEGIPPPVQTKQGRPLGPRTALGNVIQQLKPGQSVMLDQHKDYVHLRGLWSRLRPARFATRKTSQGWRVWRIE